jgi:arginase family enzyme
VSAIKNVSVISIDAHTDFRDVYVGNRFSNACVMRRIGEIIGFENIVEIGIRSSSKDEYEFVKDRIEIIDAERLKEEGPGVIQEIEQDRIYLSIDMDVLDPGISRGVGDPEPDGLSTRDLILLLRRIFEEKEVISCDIVEVNPFHDVTSFIAARIVLEILSSWELNV